MPKATSSRRQLIVYILLGLAVLGAAMRQLAPNPSLARDIGNLLLVLWVPVIGNVVGFLMGKLRLGPKPPPDFDPASAFAAHLEVEMAPLAPQLLAAAGPIAPDETRCALVLGKDAFTARLPVPLLQWLEAGQARTLQLELLRPALALARLPPTTAFRVLVGQSIVGEGRVLAPRPAAPTPDGGIG